MLTHDNSRHCKMSRILVFILIVTLTEEYFLVTTCLLLASCLCVFDVFDVFDVFECERFLDVRPSHTRRTYQKLCFLTVGLNIPSLKNTQLLLNTLGFSKLSRLTEMYEKIFQCHVCKSRLSESCRESMCLTIA